MEIKNDRIMVQSEPIKIIPNCSIEIIHGDALTNLKKIKSNSIRLVYIDPPFFTNNDFTKYSKNNRSIYYFSDKFIKDNTGKKDINVYLEFIRPIIEEIYRILTVDGSFYLHCDYHADAYLRIESDKIFGESNFQVPIYWHYFTGGGSKKIWSLKTDTILMYTKSINWIFNFDKIMTSYSKSTIDRLKYNGARTTDLEKIKKIENGEIGKIPDNVWDIFSVQGNSDEYLNYPTQKPESLLKRIIKASSNEGDLILDCFCGSGTTLLVGHQLKRNVIGIDASPFACILSAQRLNFSLKKINNLCWDLETIKTWSGYDIQNWVCSVYNIRCNGKGKDGGFDGWINNVPVQIKSTKATKPQLSAFVGDIDRINKKRTEMNNRYHQNQPLITQGWFIANEFSSDFHPSDYSIQIKMITLQAAHDRFMKEWEKQQNLVFNETNQDIIQNENELAQASEKNEPYFLKLGVYKKKIFNQT